MDHALDAMVPSFCFNGFMIIHSFILWVSKFWYLFRIIYIIWLKSRVRDSSRQESEVAETSIKTSWCHLVLVTYVVYEQIGKTRLDGMEFLKILHLT